MLQQFLCNFQCHDMLASFYFLSKVCGNVGQIRMELILDSPRNINIDQRHDTVALKTDGIIP